MVDVSSKIKALRLSEGLSQAEFADRIGVSRQSVVLWESGKRSPTKKCCLDISKEFDIDLNYLLGYEVKQPISDCVQIPIYAEGKIACDHITLPSKFVGKKSYYAEIKNKSNCIIIYAQNTREVAFVIQKIID